MPCRILQGLPHRLATLIKAFIDTSLTITPTIVKTFNLLKVTGLITLLIISFLTSCKKETEQVSPTTSAKVAVKNGRLAFKDTKTLLSVLDELKAMSIDEQAKKWEEQYSYTSLRKFNLTNSSEARLVDMHLPLSLRMVLNENGEYQVGNDIAWYNKGQVHFISNLDETQLAKVKENPLLSEHKGTVTTKKVDDESAMTTMGSISAQSGDQRDARYQHEWLMNGTSNDRRKTVYEIYVVTSQVGPSNSPYYGAYESHYDFYMKVKFEWYWRGWNPNANEWHVVQLNFSGSSQPNCNGGPTYFSYNENVYTHGDVEKTLASGSLYSTGGCSAGILNYSINGYISSDVYDRNNTSVRQTASGYSTGVGNYPLW